MDERSPSPLPMILSQIHEIVFFTLRFRHLTLETMNPRNSRCKRRACKFRIDAEKGFSFPRKTMGCDAASQRHLGKKSKFVFPHGIQIEKYWPDEDFHNLR